LGQRRVQDVADHRERQRGALHRGEEPRQAALRPFEGLHRHRAHPHGGDRIRRLIAAFRPWGGPVPEFEPWFTLVHAALRPPIAAWFNWHFEGMEHIPPEGPAVVAANHISYFDPIAHAYMLIRAGRK